MYCILQCETNDDMCSYVDIKSFIVTSGTVVSVSGSCDLVINATEVVSLAVEGVLEVSTHTHTHVIFLVKDHVFYSSLR